jgi:WD40 repeat protein
MAFSRDGRKLASSGNDNSVALVSLPDRKELIRISTQSPVRDLAFSPNGKWLVTAADDHRIRIWDAEDGSERKKKRPEGWQSMPILAEKEPSERCTYIISHPV